MKTGQRVLLFRARTEVEKRFYDGCEAGFLLNKASLLITACKNPEAMKSFVKATGGNPDELDATVFQSYVSELHFTVLHQFEALFSLILAEFQPLPHWIFLTKYQTKEIKKKAQAYVEHQYDVVSAGQCCDQFDVVARAIYPGLKPSSDMDSAWRQSIADIGWLIEEGAKRYLSSPEYNAYKHGLRVLPGSMTLMVGPAGLESDAKQLLSMPSSVTYLEEEQLDGGLGFSEVTKEVSADDAYEWVYAMSSTAEMIKSVRLALLQQVPVNVTLVTIDRKALTKLKPVSTFRISL